MSSSATISSTAGMIGTGKTTITGRINNRKTTTDDDAVPVPLLTGNVQRSCIPNATNTATVSSRSCSYLSFSLPSQRGTILYDSARCDNYVNEDEDVIII